MDEDNNAQPKTKRVRKKRLYSMILNQIEFYFTNSSLTRNKYLQGLLEKDKYIPIAELLTFNKLKALAAEPSDVVRALSTSQFLQLSPDDSAVCRRSPFTLKEDADLCTIYVENIPRSSGVEALSRTFSAYGTIDYVSAPVHRTTGQHRGFGFVEFRTPNMAHNALQAFGALGLRMPSEHYPEYLAASLGGDEASGPAGSDDDDQTDDVTSGRWSVPAAPSDTASRPGKRKPSTDSSSRAYPAVPFTNFHSLLSAALHPEDGFVVDAPLKVTRFADTPESGPASLAGGDVASRSPSQPDASTSATPADTDNSNCSEWQADGTTSCSEAHHEDASRATSQLTERTDDTDLAERRPRRRRRTRRRRKPHPLHTEHTELLAIQIMPLSEWRWYREEYRALQKENMAAIKQSLRQETPLATAPQKFVPSTVVRFTVVRTGCSDKQLVASLKQRPGVLYVELCSESEVGFLRFDCAQAAADCLASDLKDPVLIQGDEELSYWRRLVAERQLTRGVRGRSHAERGRDKLLRRLKECTQSEAPTNDCDV